MKQENQETLSTLYSIRAGLAVISGLKERADKCQRQIEAAKNQRDKFAPEVTQKEHDIEGYKNSIPGTIKNAKENIERAKLNLEMCKNNLLKEQIPAYVFLGCAVILALLALSWMSSMPFISVIVLIGAVICGVLGGVGFTTDPLKRAKAGIVEYEKKLKEAEQHLKDVQNLAPLELEYQHLTNYKKELARLNEVYEATERKCGDEIYNLVSQAELIFAVLKEQYNEFLDYRDWDYVDLMIYHFETDRVDTLRESKLLVDTQRQSDRAIEVLEQATNMICSTIKDSFFELQTTIRFCFNSLTNTLNTKFNELGGRIGTLNASIGRLSEEVRSAAAQSLSAQNMENALLAKNNVTSQKMAKDIRAMRQLAEEQGVRERMNK